MVIAKKPVSNKSESAAPSFDKAAAAFISGAGKEPEQTRKRKLPTMMRFDEATLRRIDAAASKRGLSRSGWVRYVISLALEQEGD